jgi:hypothetical protein
MSNKLYSQLGGGWTKSAKSNIYFRASWPFISLALTDDVLEYRILRQRLRIPYANIERVQIKFLSNIVFTFKGDTGEHAFAGLGLRQAVNVLQSKGVSIDQDSLRDLKFAVVVNGVLFFILFAFLAVWSAMFIWIITKDILSI